jgi:hypothetical protein
MALVRSHLWATLSSSFAAFYRCGGRGAARRSCSQCGPIAFATRRYDSYADRPISADILIGIMLILAFGLELRWFHRRAWDVSASGHARAHAGAFAMASTRLTRSAMLDVLHLDYINTARQRAQQSPSDLEARAENAAIPVVTIGNNSGRCSAARCGPRLSSRGLASVVWRFRDIIVTTRWCRRQCSSLRRFRPDQPNSGSCLHHPRPAHSL